MKKITLIAASLLVAATATAQSKALNLPDYEFVTEVSNPITSIKNQSRSGTCWAFSTLAFLESEAIRIGKIKDAADYPDFSEFFVVSHSYMDKAVKYVRLDGNLNFAAGSEGDDVLHVVADYGIVPQAEMTGMNYGTPLPAQSELDAVLRSYVETVVKNPNKTLTTAWKPGFKGILDAYLGAWPETFEVDGKQYDPISYRDALGISADNYVTLSSFTHHPFYTWFPIELADNWRWDQVYNVPIDELMSVLEDAVRAGYTIEWAADVSVSGFTRDGIAVLVDHIDKVTSGSDQEHWLGKEEGKPAPVIKKVVEKVPTQESRQFEFDNKTLTDDHGMQIYGIARDKDGNKFFMVKNSWGETGKYKGIWYVSEAFVKAQTISITLHKDALPKKLSKQIAK